MFALLLLGYIARQALNCHRPARLPALMQAQLQIQHPAVLSLVAQWRTVDRLSGHSPPQQECGIGAARGSKRILKGLMLQRLAHVPAETILPRRIHIEELSPEIQSRHHLAGVFKQVAVAFAGRAQRLI